jgi:hypothetical protein
MERNYRNAQHNRLTVTVTEMTVTEHKLMILFHVILENETNSPTHVN